MADEKNPLAALILAKVNKTPSSESEMGSEEGMQDEKPEGEYTFDECIQRFMDAMKSDDTKMVGDAFRKVFEELEKEPHEEAPHAEAETPEGE